VLQPSDPNSLTNRPLNYTGADLTHHPDGLVARNEGKGGVSQLTFNDVKIRPADPTNSEAN
jgi:hypothetical protein